MFICRVLIESLYFFATELIRFYPATPETQFSGREKYSGIFPQSVGFYALWFFWNIRKIIVNFKTNNFDFDGIELVFLENIPSCNKPHSHRAQVGVVMEFVENEIALQ